MKIHHLIEILAEDNKGTPQSASERINQLEGFQFNANSIMNSLGQLMKATPEGNRLKQSDTVFTDIGLLFSMLAELTTLCEENKRYYQNLKDKEGTVCAFN